MKRCYDLYLNLETIYCIYTELFNSTLLYINRIQTIGGKKYLQEYRTFALFSFLFCQSFLGFNNSNCNLIMLALFVSNNFWDNFSYFPVQLFSFIRFNSNQFSLNLTVQTPFDCCHNIALAFLCCSI